jgi:septum formation protein
MTDKLILASASPRRKELLGLIGLNDFEIIPADSEADFPSQLPIEQAVEYIALKKAEAVSEKASKAAENAIILAADTLVWLEGRVLGKPADEAEAAQMLKALSGKKHTVYTGMALIKGKTVIKSHAVTDVWFREMTDREIDTYVKTGEPLDKAGAYGAQGLASMFISRIDGEYYNVVGLPLCTLGTMFKSLGSPVIDEI